MATESVAIVYHVRAHESSQDTSIRTFGKTDDHNFCIERGGDSDETAHGESDAPVVRRRHHRKCTLCPGHDDSHVGLKLLPAALPGEGRVIRYESLQSGFAVG